MDETTGANKSITALGSFKMFEPLVEAFLARLLAIVRHMQHHPSGQIAHHSHVLVALLERRLLHPKPLRRAQLATSETTRHRSSMTPPTSSQNQPPRCSRPARAS